MREKNGFALLEILIASAIGAFIIVGLYRIMSQVNLSFTEMNRIASIDNREFLLQNQLERDLSGAFIIFESKQTGTGSNVPPSGQTSTGSTPPSSGAQANPALKKAFYSKNNGENLKVLSFITNNPLRTFPNDRPTPLIVRVIYKLVRDKEKTKNEKNISFKLFRQESYEYLDFDAFEKSATKSTNFEIVKNIKKLSVEYIVTVTAQDTASSAGPRTPPSLPPGPNGPTPPAPATTGAAPGPVKYETYKNWTENEIKKTKKEKPDFYKFAIEFWDDQKKTYKAMKSEQQIQTTVNLDVSVTENKESSIKTGVNCDVAIGSEGARGAKGANKNSRAKNSLWVGGNKNIGMRNGSQVGGQVGANGGQKRKSSIFDVFLSGKK